VHVHSPHIKHKGLLHEDMYVGYKDNLGPPLKLKQRIRILGLTRMKSRRAKDTRQKGYRIFIFKH